MCLFVVVGGGVTVSFLLCGSVSGLVGETRKIKLSPRKISRVTVTFSLVLG